MFRVGYVPSLLCAELTRHRRKRFDIIQVFKIIHKIDDIDMYVSYFSPFRRIVNLEATTLN